MTSTLHPAHSATRDEPRPPEVHTDEALQREARALADPTRLQVYRAIAYADHPVGVSELARECGVHPNTIRLHLTKLRQAGLILESVEVRHTRGRPGYRYKAAPRGVAPWRALSSYEQLARLLAEAIRTGKSPREVGHSEGARRAPPAEIAVEEKLTAGMSQDGTYPRIDDDDSGFELVFDTCPFVRVAEVDSHTVCQLHLGIAEGLAQSLGSVEVGGVRLRKAIDGGCRIRVLRSSSREPEFAPR